MESSTDYKIYYLEEINYWAIKSLLKGDKTNDGKTNDELSVGDEFCLRLATDNKRVGIVISNLITSKSFKNYPQNEDNVKVLGAEKVKIIGYLSPEDSKPYLPYLKKDFVFLYTGVIANFDKEADPSRMLKVIITINSFR